MVFHSLVHCNDSSCRLSPWASQSVSLQSCLACQDYDSECSRRPEWVVGVQVPSLVDPVQYRPVHPTVDPSPYREIQHRVGETVPIVVENTRPPRVRTVCSSDKSLLPTKTPLMNTASPLCQRFPPWRPRCVGFGTLTRTIFRERYDFMSVMFTMGLFVRRHSVALRFVSTDLPSRMTQQPCPDRFVRAKSFTAAKAHLVICTNRPRSFLNSLDRTLSRIRC